jgi:UDP-N-acetylmuramoyl-L-alanyl-D-glutamate--2,6-diaminopimelate ligase
MIQEVKNIGHFFETHLWRIWYGKPDADMHIYGVTGTNGKTTTSYLLTSIFEHAHGKEKIGMLTTVSFRLGGKEEINTSKMTTLPSKKVFAYLARMRQAEVKYVVLETTSHALHQHRLAGIAFDGAIILNIAREHLDYHKTMEKYAAAKEMIVSHLKKDAPLVGKEQDIFVRAMLNRAEKKGIRVVRMKDEDIEQTVTPLAGSINKENAAAASLLARAVGVSDEAIRAGVNAVTFVPGRMETIEAPQGFTIVIDYAVTPDALERLYADMKKKTKGRILGIVGAAGMRDRGKRPHMARTVAKYADRIVVTREDPWTESEDQIFADLEEGLQGTSVPWERIVDRREAIQALIQDAKPGDIVIVTGKGAERGMGVGKEIIPWNEREVIEGIFKKI